MLVTALVCACCAVSYAQEPDEAYRAAFDKAWPICIDLREQVDLVLEDPHGAFPHKLLEDLATHFTAGVGHDRVDKTVCRPYTLLLMERVAGADEEGRALAFNKAISNSGRLHQHLDDKGIKMFREIIVEILTNSDDYLSPPVLSGEVAAEAVTVKEDGVDIETTREALLSDIMTKQRKILVRLAGWVLVSEDGLADQGQRELMRSARAFLSALADDEAEVAEVREAAELAVRRMDCGCVQCPCTSRPAMEPRAVELAS